MSVLLGRKIGMTSIFTETGDYVPCTVIEAGPCPVVQIRTKENDGYEAVQIGFGDIPARKVNKPVAGHFAKAKVEFKRVLREFRSVKKQVKVGDELTVEDFLVGDKIKVSGESKGRGFQGVVKRHHFGGIGMATHGQSDRPRAPGSIGSSSYPSRVFKGMRMAGRMGGDRITVRNLKVLRIVPESNLLIVKGSIPGAPNTIVEIVKL
ncbi:MAG: 50S ribosomal protein L3 [Candidatus Kapaibacterium sp.]|nr:MAG: 50S ribosomal protein L3 [Candidatus Kapabacteria bacterium]